MSEHKTDNEIIAEFMGDESKPFGLYETTWDWLMPVIAKIDSMMPSIRIPEDLEKLKNNCHGSEPYMEVSSLPISTPIKEVHQKIVEFIKRYNENGK